MKLLIAMAIMLSLHVNAKYLDSKSCQECHEDIYYEHTKSMHHQSSLFSDAVHRKVKEMVNKEKYACALCHMPSTQNLAAMIRGTEQPDDKDVRQRDGVSCFYCHQISKVHHGKTYNINFSSASDGEKPTMFGNLKNPDDSDKHHADSNEIYKNSEVCMGCHSHKENGHEFQVCNTLDQNNSRSDCIGCHMPKAPGGNEKFNKRGRTEYATHRFLGIHSEAMVKKAIELKLSYDNNKLTLEIDNKMGHAVITHPMRLKFAKTTVSRDGKVIWSNFENSPLEDKEASFIIVFKDANDAPSMPHDAIGYKLNQNLQAMSAKRVTYEVPKLQKGDVIASQWISYIVNPKVAKKLEITDETVTKPIEGFKAEMIVQ